MSFAKFVYLLEDSSLYFSSPRKLGDPFEGSFSKLNISDDPRVLVARYPDLATYADDDRTRLVEGFRNTRMMIYSFGQTIVLINCWHMNDFESAAMWSAYAPMGQGIALQTTYRRLGNALRDVEGPENVGVIGGKVKYIDYETDWVPTQNALESLLRKRKSFEHEREFRAMCLYPPIKGDDGQYWDFDGISLRVDLHELIEKIYVAPESQSWQVNLVERVVERYALPKSLVNKSSLNDPALV